MKRKPIFACAQLNARIMPVARGERFETPLAEALAENGLGEVGGGGTMQLKTGEIEYCGIGVDLFDVEKGGRFVCDFLTARGAPKGSKLCCEYQGKDVVLPFGTGHQRRKCKRRSRLSRPNIRSASEPGLRRSPDRAAVEGQ